MPLSNAIKIHARQQPRALAVRMSGTSYSYGDLYDKVARMHGALLALPRRARPEITLSGDARLFAYTAGNHPTACILLAAAMATPHAVELLDNNWPGALHRDTLAKLTPDIVFCLSSQSDLVAAAQRLNVPVVRVDTDEFDAFLATSEPIEIPLPSANDAFMVGFTSGTTSRPKAYARARHSWRVSLDASRVAFALTKKSHTFAPGPLAHGITLYAFAETLDLGAAFHGLGQFDLLNAHRAMAQTRRIVAVPTLLSALAHGAPQEQIVEITTAGAKLDPGLLEKARAAFPKARIHEYYGASELGFISLNTHGRQSSSAPPHSVGHPFPHVSMSIRENGQELPQGTSGTIFIRGDLAIDGYLWGGRNSGFRREGPWATVGDIGRLNNDGSLSILGREGGMVITGGHNVYPQEIETALVEIPDIEGAVVLGLAHPTRGQEIVAIIHGTAPMDEIRARLTMHLPRYKLPRRFYRIETWPLTGSGKIARAALQGWLDRKDARLVPITT